MPDDSRSGGLTPATLSLDETPTTHRPDELAPGTLVGEWVLGNARGRGGFGVVYRATHMHTREPVAIKVLHPELARHDAVLARFDREIVTIRRLSHRNIVRTIGNGELHDGRPYLVMDWLDGLDLAEIVRGRGPLSPDEAHGVLAQVTAALEAVHAAGVVHRDLKPTNLIAVGQSIILVDFGIAKLLEPGTIVHTETGVRLGTPQSMAPEQILGGEVDTRTDIYALGLLLFFLMTGRFPFSSDNVAEIERMHLTSPRPRASSYARVPTAVDAVIARAMSVAREDRQARAYELLDDLARALHDGVPTPLPTIAIVVRVDVELAPTIDDAGAIAIDDLMVAARERLARAGVSINVDSSNLLVASARSDDARALSAIGHVSAELQGTRVTHARITVRTRYTNDPIDVDGW